VCVGHEGWRWCKVVILDMVISEEDEGWNDLFGCVQLPEK